MNDRRAVLLRIDDIGFHHPSQNQIMYHLCKAGLRVTCSVVPQWLAPQCAAFLHWIADQFPGHLEVHQHGYSHRNHGDDNDDQYEFGAKRSFEEQLEDVLHGRMVLESSFGSVFFPVFTPPFGVYNHDTLLALRAADFQAISSFHDDEPNDILPGVAPTVDCFRWHPVREKSWAEIVSEWQASSHLEVSGFILHPRFMKPESVMCFSNKLPTLIRNYTTVTFSDLLVQ